MRIGIIGPSEEEINGFIVSMDQVTTSKHGLLTFHKGTYQSLEVIALYSGVCKVNAAIATQLLIDKFQVSHVFLTGVAGGIDPKLRIGDTVIGTSHGYHDVDPGILTDYHPWMADAYFYPTTEFDDHISQIVKDTKYSQTLYQGTIVTGEAFISKEGRDQIIAAHNPLCVDMETASVAHVCYANDIPFLAIRTITDTEDQHGIATFEENCAQASAKSIAVLQDLLTRIQASQ